MKQSKMCQHQCVPKNMQHYFPKRRAGGRVKRRLIFLLSVLAIIAFLYLSYLQRDLYLSDIAQMPHMYVDYYISGDLQVWCDYHCQNGRCYVRRFRLEFEYLNIYWIINLFLGENQIAVYSSRNRRSVLCKFWRNFWSARNGKQSTTVQKQSRMPSLWTFSPARTNMNFSNDNCLLSSFWFSQVKNLCTLCLCFGRWHLLQN